MEKEIIIDISGKKKYNRIIIEKNEIELKKMRKNNNLIGEFMKSIIIMMIKKNESEKGKKFEDIGRVKKRKVEVDKKRLIKKIKKKKEGRWRKEKIEWEIIVGNEKVEMKREEYIIVDIIKINWNKIKF